MKLIAIAILAASASPALAQDAAPGATPAVAQAPEPAAPPKKEKLICRTIFTTGSIMSKRECHPREVWNAVRLNDEKTMESYHNNQMPLDTRRPD